MRAVQFPLFFVTRKEKEMLNTVVVNLRHTPYDVYVGRAGHGQDGYFGNPFTASKYGREEAIRLFKVQFETRMEKDFEFRRRFLKLRGKRLGCFCKPSACHADIYVEWFEKHPPETTKRSIDQPDVTDAGPLEHSPGFE